MTSEHLAAIVILALATYMSGAVAQEPHLTVSLDVVNPHGEVVAGEDLTTVANFVSRGFAGRFDVVLTYTIKKVDGELVLSESETIAIEVRNSFSKTFSIGEDMEGPYIIEVTAEPLTSQGKQAKASKSFQVVKMSQEESGFFNTLLMVALVIFGIALVYEHHRTTVLFKLSEESLKRRVTK